MGAMFPHLFNPEDLGKSLREVSADVVKTSRRDVLSRWFHSAKDADLFIWMDLKKNIFKQQLSFYGQIVEWNVIEGVKTGHVVVEETRGTGKKSEFLRFDEKPQPTSIAQATALLGHVTDLSTAEREELAANFRKLGTSQNMPPEEMISRFGEFLGGEPRAESPSVRERIVLWCKRLFKV